jgi:hypothetical protein
MGALNQGGTGILSIAEGGEGTSDDEIPIVSLSNEMSDDDEMPPLAPRSIPLNM